MKPELLESQQHLSEATLNVLWYCKILYLWCLNSRLAEGHRRSHCRPVADCISRFRWFVSSVESASKPGGRGCPYSRSDLVSAVENATSTTRAVVRLVVKSSPAMPGFGGMIAAVSQGERSFGEAVRPLLIQALRILPPDELRGTSLGGGHDHLVDVLSEAFTAAGIEHDRLQCHLTDLLVEAQRELLGGRFPDGPVMVRKDEPHIPVLRRDLPVKWPFRKAERRP